MISKNSVRNVTIVTSKSTTNNHITMTVARTTVVHPVSPLSPCSPVLLSVVTAGITVSINHHHRHRRHHHRGHQHPNNLQCHPAYHHDLSTYPHHQLQRQHRHEDMMVIVLNRPHHPGAQSSITGMVVIVPVNMVLINIVAIMIVWLCSTFGHPQWTRTIHIYSSSQPIVVVAVLLIMPSIAARAIATDSTTSIMHMQFNMCLCKLSSPTLSAHGPRNFVAEA